MDALGERVRRSESAVLLGPEMTRRGREYELCIFVMPSRAVIEGPVSERAGVDNVEEPHGSGRSEVYVRSVPFAAVMGESIYEWKASTSGVGMFGMYEYGTHFYGILLVSWSVQFGSEIAQGLTSLQVDRTLGAPVSTVDAIQL